jgi:hypothetical protein
VRSSSGSSMQSRRRRTGTALQIRVRDAQVQALPAAS